MDQLLEANLSRYADPVTVGDYTREAYHQLRLMRAVQLVQAHLANGSTLVEVGPGSSWSPAWLAQRGYRVITLDAAYRAFRPPNRCAGVACDLAEFLPLASESVDGIVAAEVVEHLFDTERFLAECRRILRLLGLLRYGAGGSYAPHDADKAVARHLSRAQEELIGRTFCEFDFVDASERLIQLTASTQVALRCLDPEETLERAGYWDRYARLVHESFHALDAASSVGGGT